MCVLYVVLMFGCRFVVLVCWLVGWLMFACAIPIGGTGKGKRPARARDKGKSQSKGKNKSWALVHKRARRTCLSLCFFSVHGFEVLVYFMGHCFCVFWLYADAPVYYHVVLVLHLIAVIRHTC